MSPHEKRNYHPADRLYVSSQGYTEKHVKNIAVRLAERHNAAIPNYYYQDNWARWILENFQRDEIADVERLVRQSYSYGEKIYRRGRPIGSKNRRHYEPSSSSADNSSWEADLGLSEAEATPAPTPLQTPASEPLKAPSADLSRYVLKTELEGHINRIGNDVNTHMRNHNEAIKTYCELSMSALESKIAAINLQRPTIVTLERKELGEINLGVQHRNFPKLLKACNAQLRNKSKLNIWIYGPAGTGKSTAAEKVAEALSLPFHTNGKLATEYAVLGFINTTGYQTTEFRKAYEFGGIYLADEIDGSMPDALLALNSALANGHCVFPDKVVKRHPNFLFLAAANTTGIGATLEYVGRFKQDAAFNDRFIFIDWPLDEALEDSLVADKDWLKIVRTVRANIIKAGIKNAHLVTPRASIYGESLIAGGFTIDETIESVLKKGMSADQWRQVKP